MLWWAPSCCSCAVDVSSEVVEVEVVTDRVAESKIEQECGIPGVDELKTISHEMPEVQPVVACPYVPPEDKESPCSRGDLETSKLAVETAANVTEVDVCASGHGPTLLDSAPCIVNSATKERSTSFGMHLPKIDSFAFDGPPQDDCVRWWSSVPRPIKRLEKDMPNHRVAAEVLKAICMPKPPKLEDTQLHWFDKYRQMGELKTDRRYLVTAFVFGKFILVVLSEVMDDVFEEIISGNFLNDRLKLVVTPVNMGLPIPLKGPKDADTIGQYFGMRNVRFARGITDGIDCATLTVDVYSSFTLRMAMPSLAFKPGRIADFHIVSYKDHASLLSLRIATTKELVQQMNTCAKSGA